jgi:hypothetical protein
LSRVRIALGQEFFVRFPHLFPKSGKRNFKKTLSFKGHNTKRVQWTRVHSSTRLKRRPDLGRRLLTNVNRSKNVQARDLCILYTDAMTLLERAAEIP